MPVFMLFMLNEYKQFNSKFGLGSLILFSVPVILTHPPGTQHNRCT